MQTGFIYGSPPRYVRLCALKPSRYTGKERDTESGLDYFGARYYASSMGLWVSPDWADKPEAVPYSDLARPQSLNLYGFVGCNPLSKADPDGHAPGDPCWCQQAAQSITQAWGSYWENHNLTYAKQNIERWSSDVSNAVKSVNWANFDYSGPDPIPRGSRPIGNNAQSPKASPSGQTSSPTGPESGEQPAPKDEGPRLVSNSKHNQKSASPEPKNADDLFKSSVADKSGVRWAKDANGTIHRFSAPSNNESHWNGSTAGPRGIQWITSQVTSESSCNDRR